jgi:poly(3-hydroxybutyrate) depolymerase
MCQPAQWVWCGGSPFTLIVMRSDRGVQSADMARAFVLIGGLALLTATPVLAQKVEKVTFDADGRKRVYYAFVPDAARNAPAPLLLLLHGSGRDGRSLLDPWQGLAKKEGIILLGLESLNRQEWNMGSDGPDLVYRVIEEARAKHNVDGRRIYVFGHSAGAIQGLALAVLESEYFAAVAVHAGVFFQEFSPFADNAPRKIPLGIWVGTNDALFPLDAVRASRTLLESKGFAVKLTEIRGHTHRYYDRAGEINKEVWAFLEEHRLAAEPNFQKYAR